jgi:hypothetical protein
MKNVLEITQDCIESIYNMIIQRVSPHWDNMSPRPLITIGLKRFESLKAAKCD